MPHGVDRAGSGRTLLIVGGTGFIGKWLAKLAEHQDYQVSVLSSSAAFDGSQFECVEHLQADIRDLQSLRDVLGERRYDYVVNCAGYVDHSSILCAGRKVIEAHFTGVMNLAECVAHKGLQRFVQVGSSDEYGANSAPQREDARENPISPYSLGKVAATHFIQLMHTTESFPGVVVRLFLAYGPGQGRERFLPQVIQGCIEDREFPVSEGEQVRDFCFVEDIAGGILAALRSPDIAGKVVNIGSGNPVRIRDVIQLVRTVVGKGKPQFGALPYRSGENMRLYADIGNARKYLGWRPAVGLEEGVRRTVRWFCESAPV